MPGIFALALFLNIVSVQAEEVVIPGSKSNALQRQIQTARAELDAQKDTLIAKRLQEKQHRQITGGIGLLLIFGGVGLMCKH